MSEPLLNKTNPTLRSKKSLEIQSSVTTISTDMNSLSVNAADLSEKVHSMVDKMENVVDEDKLREAVNKLLEVSV